MTDQGPTWLKEDLDAFIAQREKGHPLTLESLPSELHHYFHATIRLLAGIDGPLTLSRCNLGNAHHDNLISDIGLLVSITRLQASEITPVLRDWAVYSTLSIHRKGAFFQAPIERLLCRILDNVDEALSGCIDGVEADMANEAGTLFSPRCLAWDLTRLRHVRLGEEILEFGRLVKEEVEDKYGAGDEVGKEDSGSEGDEEDEVEDAMSVLTIGSDGIHAPIR